MSPSHSAFYRGLPGCKSHSCDCDCECAVLSVRTVVTIVYVWHGRTTGTWPPNGYNESSIRYRSTVYFCASQQVACCASRVAKRTSSHRGEPSGTVTVLLQNTVMDHGCRRIGQQRNGETLLLHSARPASIGPNDIGGVRSSSTPIALLWFCDLHCLIILRSTPKSRARARGKRQSSGKTKHRCSGSLAIRPAPIQHDDTAAERDRVHADALRVQ